MFNAAVGLRKALRSSSLGGAVRLARRGGFDAEGALILKAPSLSLNHSVHGGYVPRPYGCLKSKKPRPPDPAGVLLWGSDPMNTSGDDQDAAVMPYGGSKPCPNHGRLTSRR